MGADIHTHIEYRLEDNPDGTPYWDHWCKCRFGRDYSLFGLMAGVRDQRQPPVVSPRGIPDRLSWGTRDAYTLLVLDDPKTSETGCCARVNAEGWVKNGQSRWWNDKQNRVTDPDAHTPSWMKADELEQAVNLYAALYKEEVHADVYAALAAMRAFEQRNLECRLVFWFDN